MVTGKNQSYTYSIAVRNPLFVYLQTLFGYLFGILLAAGVAAAFIYGDTYLAWTASALIIAGMVSFAGYGVLFFCFALASKKPQMNINTVDHSLNLSSSPPIKLGNESNIKIIKKNYFWYFPRHYKYQNHTYLIYVNSPNQKLCFVWDANWAVDGAISKEFENDPILHIINELQTAGVQKENIKLKKGNIKMLIFFLLMAAIVWFVFFY